MNHNHNSMIPLKWISSSFVIILFPLYLFSVSSCFMQDFVLVDKKMEFHAYGVITQASVINQKGDFIDKMIVTREDILGILSADVVNDAEIIDLNIRNMVGVIKDRDYQSNQANSLDLELKFNNEEVFNKKNMMVFTIDQNSETEGSFIEGSPIDFSPKMGIVKADNYINNLIQGNNNTPLILNLFVSPHNPDVKDPYTSLELEWRIGIVVKYSVCTTVPVGTQAEDCNKN